MWAYIVHSIGIFIFWKQLRKSQLKSQENLLLCLSESVAKTSLLALVSASLFLVDPALAFKVKYKSLLTILRFDLVYSLSSRINFHFFGFCYIVWRRSIWVCSIQKVQILIIFFFFKSLVIFTFTFCWWHEFWQGGGPYGAEVTRGQDLTGKDFSGKTLIKQDFKTVSIN